MTTRFAVTERTATHCSVRAGELAVPEPVEGIVLEAQFSVGEFGLLVLSDDCPYEEILHFSLLDASLRLADGLELGAPYTAGVFALTGFTDAPGITFTFDGDALYELVIHRSPRRVLRPSIRGVRRRGGWLKPRYLELRAA